MKEQIIELEMGFVNRLGKILGRTYLARSVVIEPAGSAHHVDIDLNSTQLVCFSVTKLAELMKEKPYDKCVETIYEFLQGFGQEHDYPELVLSDYLKQLKNGRKSVSFVQFFLFMVQTKNGLKTAKNIVCLHKKVNATDRDYAEKLAFNTDTKKQLKFIFALYSK